MTLATLIVIVLVIAGLAASRLRGVQQLNSRRFMPVVYAALTVFFALRAYDASIRHGRIWPDLLLALLSLFAVVQSARLAWIATKP
jgi:hypothetical protein